MDTKNVSPDAEAFAAAYRQHATTLRNWFVAYGVGGPVVLLTNSTLLAALKASSDLATVGWSFLLGVGLQVLLALIDKYADWICYRHALHPDNPATKCQRLATWWVEANAPSFLMDLSSMVLLSVATVTVFRSATL